MVPPPLPQLPECMRLYYLGFLEEALKSAQEAINQNSNDLTNYVYEVNILAVQENFEAAKEIIDQLVLKDTRGTRFHTAYGLLYEYEGKDLDNAWYEYQAGIKIDPGFWVNYARCARIGNECKDYTTALSYYNQAIAVYPCHYILIGSRGCLLANLERYVEAERDGLLSLSINKDYPYSYEAIVRGQLGLDKESQQTLDYLGTLESLIKSMERKKNKEFSSWHPWILNNKKWTFMAMNRFEESLEQQAKYYEIEQFKDESADQTDPDWKLCYRTCYQHFSSIIQPRIASANEKLLGIWYPFFSYGFKTNTSWGDGNSYYHHEGSYGAGYICITNRNIYINNFGELTKIFLKGKNIGLFMLGMAFRNFDNTKRELKDKSWTFPVTSVTSVMNKEKSIRVIFGRDEWSFSETGNDREMLFTALSLCQSGRINELWKKELPPALPSTNPGEVLAAVEKLSELHKNGILTDQEFESKKAVLLDQIQ